jgi:hypothetical protein
MTPPKILLDSGAYSAWTLGATINLDDYIEFIKRNEHLLDFYINLDVIPGSDGQRHWRSDQIEKAAAASYCNQQRLRDAALKPIPVFHQGEPFKWLDRYLQDGEPYIALAPSDGGVNALPWLDDCFALLKGRLHVKVHGLGLTTPLILHRYPWASVDSATWLKQSSVGQIPIPLYRDGKPDYGLRPEIFVVSDRARARGGRHIESADDFDLERIQRYLNEHVGIDVLEARYSEVHRWRVWITYFRGLEVSSSTRIIFVTNIDHRQNEILTQQQVHNRLLSFFRIKDTPRTALEDYIAGRMHPAKRVKTRFKRDIWYKDAYWDHRRLAAYQRHKGYEERAEIE